MSPQTQRAIHQELGCAYCRLRGICLLEEMNEAAESLLHKIVKRSSPVPNNTFLFQQGDTFEYLYTVKSGAFKSFMTNANSDEQILGFHLPGDLIGIDAIDKQRHTTSLQALQDSSVCRLSWKDFKVLAEKCHHFYFEPLSIASRELVHAHELVYALGQMSARQKLVYFLLTLSRRMGALGFSKTQLYLTMSRHEIANFLGITSETVSREFSHLQNQGLLQVNRQNILIKDWEQLQALIE